MDKIKKFLNKLSKKERKELLEEILPKVRRLDLKNLDVKKLKGFENLYRVRIGRIRVVFEKKGIGLVRYIGFRKDAYRN